MLSIFTVALLGLSTAYGSPLQKRADNTQPAGTNPIKISSVNYLGEQTSDNTCSHRDLGFTGKIGGKWYAIYGDDL
ncbi:hypothetical protein LTS18_013186, partial [Coniosporium uncinatum]